MATASSLPVQTQAELETLLNGPAGAPPPGVQPNFDNPANLDIIVYIIVTTSIVSSSLAVLVRIYTRHILLRSLGYDDYICVISWLGKMVYAVLILLGVKAGSGTHMWDIQLKNFFGLLYWANITTVVYGPVVFFIKFSILLQYSRVFNPIGKADLPIFVAIRICTWSIFIFYLAVMLFTIFQCNPREKIWNKLETTGYCYNSGAIYKASGIFNVLSDFAILILPMPSVWRLQMSLRKKLMTTGVFAIGFFACATSILRTHFTWLLVDSSDESYLYALFCLWSAAEISSGIIVGCFPIMPRFFQHVGPKVRDAIPSWSSSTKSRKPRIGALTTIKSPFSKYRTGPSVRESPNGPYAQLHGQNYALNDLKRPRPQEEVLVNVKSCHENDLDGGNVRS